MRGNCHSSGFLSRETSTCAAPPLRRHGYQLQRGRLGSAQTPSQQWQSSRHHFPPCLRLHGHKPQPAQAFGQPVVWLQRQGHFSCRQNRTASLSFGVAPNARSEQITFDIVDMVYPYNAIMGRGSINKFEAAIHGLYLCMKIPGPLGAITVYGNQQTARNIERDFVPGQRNVHCLTAQREVPASVSPTESRLEGGGMNRAKLKFSKLITTTRRVSVRNIIESEREGAKQIVSEKSVTRRFVSPRFGSRKPTPR